MSILKVSGNLPVYRFYVSLASSISMEVFPLNFLETSIRYTKEKDQVFYRRKFSGNLIFGTNSRVADDAGVMQNRKDDWAYFWDIEQTDPCEPIYLTITKTVSGDTETYCECVFSTNDGEIDIDRCTMTVSPTIIDDYINILDTSDIEYNILDSIFGVTTVVTTRAIQAPYDSEFDRNRWLYEVIEYLADKVAPGCNISSEFFTAATNPVTLTTNRLTLLTIAHKADIVTPTDPAMTIALLSWNSLMEILWGMFQVKWDYNSITDTINVEHISWWEPVLGLDLRTQQSCVATNKYSWTKDKMPKYEKISFMEAEDANFVGVPIWYDSHCVNQDPDSNTQEIKINVTTDLNFILSKPDSISKNGFVILANYLDGVEYKVLLEVGSYSPTTLLNMPLSVANLENYYYRHNRTLIEGYLNGSLTTFWSAKKTKLQKCSAITCEEFDPDEEIITELGEVYFSGARGIVQDAELRPTGQLNLQLLYGPEDNTPTPISPVTKGIHMKEEERTHAHWGHFYATLSEAAPAGGLVIKVTGRVLGDSWGGSGVTCTSIQQTWTIAEGLTTSDFQVLNCHSIDGDNYCPDFVWDLTSATLTGWEVDIEYDTKYSCP